MNSTDNSNGAREARLIGLALTTALAGVTLTGCAASAPPASLSANQAEAALASGKFGPAIGHAEDAVRAEPRNASYRAMLGAAYLDAGRFGSAATSFDDAMALGDNSPRTALSLALALAADGKGQEAVAVLNDWEGEIAAGDLGLAYALAGQTDRGIHILTNALRSGQNTAKIRQNLAYSYALAGRWREARLTAAQDVPGDQLGDRMAEWAVDSHPDAYQFRVAKLLAVPFKVTDPGQPAQLALSNFPKAEQLAAEASAVASPVPLAAYEPAPAPVAQRAQAPAQPASFELPPIGDPVDPNVAVASYEAPQTAKADNFESAFKAPAPAGGSLASVAMDTMRFVQTPSVQQTPTRSGVAPAKSGFVESDSTTGSHLIQLGSFSSEQGARRAWGIYVKRYPELAGHDMVITEAVVKGKRYWRVSAAGYDASSSRAMCGKVKSSSSDGCFAYAEGRPLPGAVDDGRRFAMR